MNTPYPPVKKRIARVCLPLAGLLAASLVLGLAVGSSPVGVRDLAASWLGGDKPDPMTAAIVLKLRLPRTLLAALAGGCLSLGGLVFQALLRNPLAEPYILGVSGGAALGAVIGVIIGLPVFWGAGPLAFIGALAALGAVLVLAGGTRDISKNSLILAGVMINTFCSAVILFFISIAHSHQLKSMLTWLMGDASAARTGPVLGLAVLVLPCFAVIFALSHRLNILLLGRETAKSLGVHVRAVSVALLTAATLMIGGVVSHTGLLGFVGLVSPHILRLTVGADHRVLAPACVLFGASFLVLCDVLARVLSRQTVMPVGVITAMIGAPLFLYLLRRKNA